MNSKNSSETFSELFFVLDYINFVKLVSVHSDNVGTNIQKKLIAVHDLDIPWRPADLEQRAGRISRHLHTPKSRHSVLAMSESSKN